jgi:hypothetical protein
VSLKPKETEMLKTALVAASLVLAATAANASTRAGLESGFHGNAATAQAINAAPRVIISSQARGAFASAPAQKTVKMNPLVDMFHGLMVRY